MIAIVGASGSVIVTATCETSATTERGKEA